MPTSRLKVIVNFSGLEIQHHTAVWQHIARSQCRFIICPFQKEVWLSAVNDLGIPSYFVIDYIQHFKFGEVRSDIFGNPGKIDDRLLDNKNDETPIVYIGSLEDFMPLKRDKETDNKKETPEKHD